MILTRQAEILFLPHHNERLENFIGRRVSAEDRDAGARSGFETVLPIERFEEELLKGLASGPDVYVRATEEDLNRMKAFVPLRELRPAQDLLARYRMKKSPAEIALLEHAAEVSVQAQRAAWKRMKPGAFEYEVQAAFSEVMLSDGCENYAYPPIIGSGPNSTVLHYEANRRRMDRGEVGLIDAAAQCEDYASDVTRTIPVGGRFSPREREIYEIVLGAQKAAITALKPGTTMSDLYKIAHDYIDSHGKDGQGKPLGKYFTHGLGHNVGLDVHDPPEDSKLKIEEGMVLTIEPGIYIPEESVGVRIEYTLLVTRDGARILSAGLPKEPAEVERALSGP